MEDRTFWIVVVKQDKGEVKFRPMPISEAGEFAKTLVGASEGFCDVRIEFSHETLR